MNNNVVQYLDGACYGCGVCAIICPKKIITINENNCGFYIPVISDNDLCINCGLCLDVCSYYHDKISLPEKRLEKLDAYASWSNNHAVRRMASSGGTGFEIARYLFLKGFSLCGVRYNTEKQIAEHFITEDLKEYEKSMGSKYIPSYTFDAFRSIDKNKKYFITGTPCQIDSLRRYIKKKKLEDNFVLLDFFCHGVPSLLLWRSYLKTYQQEKNSDVRWRNKELGWHNSWVLKFFKSGKECYASNFKDGDIFYNFFLGHRCLNQACFYKCKYKHTQSAADIRIGDLWGTKYKTNDEGITGMLVFSEKGKDIINEISKFITFSPESIECVTEAQMKKCATPSPSYNYVMNAFVSGKNLLKINRVANIIDFLGYLPKKMNYYSKRIVQKILKG